jgi:CRP/FNR family cyclic AMP-dependent transcriptional regulator
LLARARAPSADELAGVPWMATLKPDEAAVAAADMRVLHAEAGEFLCRVGRPVTFWFGLIDGLLKMSNDSELGMPITFTGLPPGGWFGEGTVLKHEPYRYNIQALRKSVVAGITVPTFDWLLDRSIGFNRFVMRQLNERLGQFIAAREIDRMSDPEVRVARGLAALFHPVLYPGVGNLLRITQQELGYLVGLSRQRVNQALHTLQASRMIRVEYGGVRVLDLEGMRRYTRSSGTAARQLHEGGSVPAADRATALRVEPVRRPVPAFDAKG